MEVEERRGRGEDVEDLTRPGGPAGPGGTLTSFREGLDTLPMTLARELGDSLRLGVEVEAVTPRGESGRPWMVHRVNGEPLEADAVLVGLPAPRARPVLAGVDERLASIVEEIRTAPLAVVAVALDAAEMGGAPDGFGFLVPRQTGPRILGCLWDSSIFPGRAPEGKVLLRAMIGGAHDPEAMLLTDAELRERVLADLRLIMGLSPEPLFTRVYRWRLGIGQYTVGHQSRLDRIHAILDRNPGLRVAGSSFYGISMNACIEKAGQQAEEILAQLAASD